MTSSPEPLPLERRYRRLLASYPPAYRAERSEEMIATLMSAAPTQRQWPPVADALDLGVHGLRTRLRLAARDLRTPLAADAAHHAALVTLAVAAAAAVATVVGVSFLGQTAVYRGALHRPYSAPARVAVGLLLAAMPAALIAAGCGLQRLARWLAGAGGVGALGAGAVLTAHDRSDINGSHLFGMVVVLCLPGLLLWLARPEGADVRRAVLRARCLVLGGLLSMIFTLVVGAEELAGELVAPRGDPSLHVESKNLADSGLNLIVAMTLAGLAAGNLASGVRRERDPRRLAVACAMSIPWLAAAIGTLLTPALFRPEAAELGGDRLSTNLIQVGYTLAAFGVLGVLARGSLGRSRRASSTSSPEGIHRDAC